MGEIMEGENAAFWLPTHFLTDDDFLIDRSFKENDHKNKFDLVSSAFGFDPFGGTLDSPVSSTETDKGDENNDDEFLAELTRHLAQSTLHEDHHHHHNNNNTEKPWLFSTSPQSTLTGFGAWSNRSGLTSNGSPNGPSRVPSPPLTPELKNDAAWELLYEAAGQVARLKMNAIAAQMNQQQQQQQNNRGLLGAPRNHSLSTPKLYDFSNSNNNQFQQVRRQGSSSGVWAHQQGRQEREDWYCHHHHSHQNNHQQRGSCGGAMGIPQSAWPPLRTQNNHHHNRQQNGGAQNMRGMYLSGARGTGVGPMGGMKRQSTGTGVFLPRRVGSTPAHHQPELPRKKPSGCSTVLLPARVVQALNLDLEDPNVNPQSRLTSGFPTDHEIMMARRNAILGQQRRSIRGDNTGTMVGHEVRLPSDWTY